MRSTLLLLGCIILIAIGGRVTAAPPAPDFFPLEKGNYWIYRGETKFLVPKKNPTEEEKKNSTKNEEKSEVLTWKMEVVDTLERDRCFVALIKGGPWDLAWYEPGKARGDYMILRVDRFDIIYIVVMPRSRLGQS